MPPAGTPGGGAEEEDVLGKGSKYYKVRGTVWSEDARSGGGRQGPSPTLVQFNRAPLAPRPCAAPRRPPPTRPEVPSVQPAPVASRWGRPAGRPRPPNRWQEAGCVRRARARECRGRGRASDPAAPPLAPPRSVAMVVARQPSVDRAPVAALDNNVLHPHTPSSSARSTRARLALSSCAPTAPPASRWPSSSSSAATR